MKKTQQELDEMRRRRKELEAFKARQLTLPGVQPKPTMNDKPVKRKESPREA